MKNKFIFLSNILLLNITLLAQNPRKPLDYSTNYDMLSKAANERGELYEQAYTVVRFMYRKIAELIDYEAYDTQLLNELTSLSSRLKLLMNPQIDLVSHIPEINQYSDDFESYLRRYEVRKRKILEAKENIKISVSSIPNDYEISSTKENGKLRKYSGPLSEVIIEIPSNRTIRVLSYEDGYWKIFYDGYIGFINEMYINVTYGMMRFKK